MSNLTNRLATLGGVPGQFPVILWAGHFYKNVNSSFYTASGNGIINVTVVDAISSVITFYIKGTDKCSSFDILSTHSTLIRDNYSDYYKSEMPGFRDGHGGMSVPQLRYESPYLYYKQWRQQDSHNNSYTDDVEFTNIARCLDISLTIIGYAR